MADIDPGALKEVLTPLDLIPVFQVPAGDILRGLTGREPRVEVGGVHSAALGASLGPGRCQATLEVEILDRGMVVCLRSLSPERLARRLLAVDIDLLEEIHSPEAFFGTEILPELRRICRPLLDRRLLAGLRFRGEDALLAAGQDLKKPARRLQEALRWFLAGLHFAGTGELVPRLADLADLADREGPDWVRELADRPGAEPQSGRPAQVGFWLEELEGLRDRVVEAESTAPLRDQGDVRRALTEWSARWGEASAT